jgi:hypothetical protein
MGTGLTWRTIGYSGRPAFVNIAVNIPRHIKGVQFIDQLNYSQLLQKHFAPHSFKYTDIRFFYSSCGQLARNLNH